MQFCAGVLSGFLLAVVLPGCSSTPAPMEPAALSVQLGEAAPRAGYVEVAPVSVKSGEGCGILGKGGSREDAERLLRSKAAGLNASYVRITEVREPRPNHSCLEHEYVLGGVAYRASSRPVAARASAEVSPPRSALPQDASPLTLLDYEGNGGLGRPAPASAAASVLLSLVAGEGSANALRVAFTCSGDAPADNLRVWNEARVIDWRTATGLAFNVQTDSALTLSVFFLDGHSTRYTQRTSPLAPGAWQTVTLPLDKFTHDPDGPAGDRPGAPLDVSHVASFGFAPVGCGNGQFSVDDFRLTR